MEEDVLADGQVIEAELLEPLGHTGDLVEPVQRCAEPDRSHGGDRSVWLAMPGIYDDVRIVELATGLAGPYATMFLADHGADVIKVEPANGDPYRLDPGFQTVNRNKRSAVLGDVAPLLGTADVVVIDQPGQIAATREAAPNAVVIAMPPWGERGPLVDHPATPDLVAAATGIMWNQISYSEVPVHLVMPVVGYGTGALGALAIAAGLLARDRFGAAPTYEVSQVAGAAALQLGDHQLADTDTERPGDAPMGSKGRVPVYRLFEGSDGEWFFVACGTMRFFERMAKATNRPDLIDHPLAAAAPWGLIDPDAIAYVAPILEDAFATRSRAEWLEILAAADVPAQPVQTRDEFVRSSVAVANDLLRLRRPPRARHGRDDGSPARHGGVTGRDPPARSPTRRAFHRNCGKYPPQRWFFAAI